MNVRRVLLFIALVAMVAASCAKPVATLECTNGKSACTDSCVDLQSDTLNCGKCGTACPAGQACVAGACGATCPNGNLKCDKDGGAAYCINPRTDNSNCGKCGTTCGAGQVCYGGQCSGTCGDSKSGETLCGVDAGAPYCATLAADDNNCGQCGKQCTTGQICVNKTCQPTCTSDQTQCGGDGGSAYCADLQTDNGNCGTCGHVCTNPLDSCVAGVCTSACGYGQTLCSGDAGSYCVDSLSDNANCGSCGNVCPSNNPLCSGGKCTTGGGGTVRYTNQTIANIVYVPCGNGTNTNCTEPTAETSCTNIGKKLVSHASNGTSAVVSLGATTSCYWDISYFTNNNPQVAGQCLIGVSNAQWSSCCGTTEWHGNIVTVPTTLGQQFGYVNSTDSGYNSNLSNVTGTTWGCQLNSQAPPARSGCGTYYVACL
jgi:hypothetical protein